MRTAGSFTRDAASSQSFARRRQVSARSPIRAQTVCFLDRSGCGYGVKPYFAIFLNECSPHTGGDRGKAECGASAEGWRECPALALFRFSLGTRSRRCCYSNDSGPPSPPSPSVAPVKAPLTRGFCFLGVVTTFLCADRHIRNRPWSLLSRHWGGLGGHPHPPEPPFARARSLRLRHQLQ